jgi:hypothetical protein
MLCFATGKSLLASSDQEGMARMKKTRQRIDFAVIAARRKMGSIAAVQNVVPTDRLVGLHCSCKSPDDARGLEHRAPRLNLADQTTDRRSTTVQYHKLETFRRPPSYLNAFTTVGFLSASAWRIEMLINGAFDSRTLANMNVALDRVCTVAAGGEEYSVRKLIAQRIVKCARGGKTTLGELTIAGERALARIAPATK